MSDVLLDLRDVAVEFRTPLGPVRALRGMTLEVERGTIMGLVGESGCGKTITARTIMRLLPENASVSGLILLGGRDLLALSDREMQKVRGKDIALIFQDPAAALNPVFTIGDQLLRIIDYHGRARGSGREAHALALLAECGLSEPRRLLHRYPHELSGGMQQRVMIAMALSASPALVIADEATTSLDVTIQEQILDLLLELRDRRGLTVVLVTHNIGVVARACQRVAVLYAGRVIEEGPVTSVLRGPEHPYTQALLAALPTASGRKAHLNVIPGLVPSGREAIVGCSFASRCTHVMPVCRKTSPDPVQVTPDHVVECWLHETISTAVN